MEFCTGIASGSYRCFFSLHCLATSVCASSCSSFFLSSCFPASGFYPLTLLSCLRLPWRGLSLLLLAGTLLRWFQWFLVTCGARPGAPLLSAASVCSAPIGSSAGLYGFASPLSRPSGAPCLHAVLLPGAPGFSAASFLTPFFALLLLPPLRVSLALPLRCPGLLRLLASLQFAPGFSAASSLTPFCAAHVASAAGLFAFPQLRLAPSLISLALLLSLAMLRLMLRCLGLLRLLQSSSLSVWFRSYCPFGQGLWLRSLPVLWLRFLRLSFLTFACLHLRWCLP